MRRLIGLVGLSLFLIVGAAVPVQAQGETISIRLLDRQGRETKQISDGNTVQLKAEFPAQESASTQVAFFLNGLDQALAACTVDAGASSCVTAPFSATGWHWNAGGSAQPSRTIRARTGAQELNGSLTIEVRARPVVMVHGFLSNWETWSRYLGDTGYLASIGVQGFAVGDGQAPGVLNTGSADRPAGRTNTIGQNAEILRQYIAGVRQKSGAEKVDLLVHSMGGMISRYYIDRVMKDNDVAQVIFLGTPMSGSACVFPVASLGFELPASQEIQPDYMINIFNKQIVHRRGIAFHMVAGTLLVDPLTSPCAEAPSDTVVALASARSIPLDDIHNLPLMHSDLTQDDGIFQNVVRPLLEAPPGSFTPRPDPAVPSENYVAEQFSRSYSGHLAPGQNTDVTINIDPNVTLANFSLYDTSRSLSLEVRGANGNVITLDTQKNGMLKIADPQSMIYLGYGFEQPKAGAWVVKVQTTGQTPASGADFSIDARYTGGATLEADTDLAIADVGRPVLLHARLQEGGVTLQVVAAQALIRGPDGSVETLALSAAGDRSTAAYTPTQAGLYSLEIDVTGKAPDGSAVDRAAYLSLEAQPAQENLLDQSRNGLVAIVLVICAAVLALAALGVVLVIFALRGRRKA